MAVLPKCRRLGLLVAVMSHGQDYSTISRVFWRYDQIQPVFVLRLFRIDARIMHILLHAIITQFDNHIYHSGVTQVGAVFLKG